MTEAKKEMASAQSLFEQMFALPVNDKREPIFPHRTETSSLYKKTLKCDPYDLVALLKDELDKTTSGVFGAVRSLTMNTSGLQDKLKHCQELLTECERNQTPLIDQSIDYFNSLIVEADHILGKNIMDDRMWGSKLPDALLLRNLIGGIDITHIENEEHFMVRGSNYLNDSIKIRSETPLFHLRGMQVVEQPRGISVKSTTNIAVKDWSAFPAIHSPAQTNEWLIVNYMVPGATAVNVVCYYTANSMARDVIHSLSDSNRKPEESSQKHTSNATSFSSTLPDARTNSTSFPVSSINKFPISHTTVSSIYKEYSWANSIYRFWGCNDSYRNRSFKLFPRMCKCSWAIRAAVGNKPALIGNNKLKLAYSRGKNYLEVDIDLSSSSVATHILGMVRGVSKTMVVDLGIGIEGMREDELPEAILAQTRFHYVDLDTATPLRSGSGGNNSPVMSCPPASGNTTDTTTITATAVENSGKYPVNVSAQSSFQDLNDPVALRKALNRL